LAFSTSASIYGDSEFRRRPIPLSLALHAGIRAFLLTVNADPILPLACSAVAHKLGVAPDSGEEIGTNFFEFVPTGWWKKLFVIGVRHALS
jgi:hypothetical protein